jgi:hypothetical protein
MAALDLAAVAERTHPELGERLTGAVALTCPHQDQPAQGAPALIAALTAEAAAQVATLDLSRAVPWRRPVQWSALGLLFLATAAVPAALWPGTYGVLARRFLAPWSNLERIGRFVITVTPGNRIVAVGSDLTVNARVQPRFGNHAAPDAAWFEWTEAGGNGTWHRVAMAPDAPGTPPASTQSFALTLPRLASSLTYRVGSGSALSRSYQITAIEPPAIAALTAAVEPPTYTGLAVTKVAGPGRIDAWESSRVTLNVVTSRPVAAITVAWPAPRNADQAKPKDHVQSVAALAAGGKSGTVAVTADASGPFVVTLHDAHGLCNRAEAEGTRRVVVRFDAAPVVALGGTDMARESSPTDVLILPVAARDDVAVASVELHYTLERGDGGSEAGPQAGTGQINATLPGLGTRTARGEVRLELAGLRLAPGDTLGYRVRVADNRPGPRGPNVTWSPGRTLAIVAGAEPLLARQRQEERQRLLAELEAIRQATAGNRRETEQLRYAADAAQRGNGRWGPDEQQVLERRESEARSVVDRLQLLARALAGEADPHLRALDRPTRQVAAVEAESSRAMLEQARRATGAAERLDDLRQADHRLASVEERLDDLQRQFDALARRDADLQRLRDLAGREETLAERASSRAPIDQLQREQAAVQSDLDAVLKKSPELRGDVLAAEAEEADALARRAHALAGQQNDLARHTGDVAGQEHAALAALAEAQRGLEEDARRLALEVDPALRSSGRRRLNTDLVHDPIAPLERGDLDQARQRLEAAEAELHRLAQGPAELPANQTSNAEALARRQHDVRERLQALLASQIAPQHDLRDQAVVLGRDVADLRDRAQSLSQRARKPAQDAARALGEQAPRTMDQGAERLARGQAAAARDAQHQAASVVERGAQLAEDLAAALRTEGTPGGDSAQQPRPLATARSAMRQAARDLAGAQRGQGDPDAARKAMQQAARNLRAAADRGSGTPTASSTATSPAPGAPQESDSSDPQGTLAGTGAADLAELRAMVARQTGRAWGELPGHLRTEILQMAQGRYREDYARLIQLYFREIASGAGKPEP